MKEPVLNPIQEIVSEIQTLLDLSRKGKISAYSFESRSSLLLVQLVPVLELINDVVKDDSVLLYCIYRTRQGWP